VVENEVAALDEAEKLAGLVELRLDLIGRAWPELAKRLHKPWIACNRRMEEGGRGDPNEIKREEELLRAAEAGADIIDIEYRTGNLHDFVPLLKGRAKCLISYHDLTCTPSINALSEIIEKQVKAGAQICKIVTTARNMADNLTLLRLLHEFRGLKLIAFAMGEAGRISRILSPLAGGYLTYASVRPGKESASGQMSIQELEQIYQYLKK
jgi:3-dehydroquinate dehydratase I